MRLDSLGKIVLSMLHDLKQKESRSICYHFFKGGFCIPLINCEIITKSHISYHKLHI